MKVLSVVGNRPQFIKSAPLSLALRNAGIDEVMLHTGQHYDPELSQVFFDELELAEPRYKLDLHTADVDAMLPGIVSAIEREQPDWVLVFGDTNSTLAGARLRRRDDPPRGERRAGTIGAHSRGPRADRRARRLSGASADAQSAADAFPRSCGGSAVVPRHDGSHLTGARRRHRLGRSAER